MLHLGNWKRQKGGWKGGVGGGGGGAEGVSVVVSITKLNTKIHKKKRVITRAQGQEGSELTKFSIRN